MKKNVSPSQQIMSPSQQIMSPSQQIMSPGQKIMSPGQKIIIRVIAVSLSTFTAVFIVSSSMVIAGAFTALSATITFLISKSRNNRNSNAMSSAWPEVIDHLTAGLQSGLSIAETMSDLAIRGPEVLRSYFEAFSQAMESHGNFFTAVSDLKIRCGQHGSDQIFEAIIISRTLGGAELLNVLRTVGTFLRQDLALRREIEVKHGWIKNSAHLSAAAPWLLLLLLSTQPATARAFSSVTGAVILGFGLLMTGIAYIWMNYLGKLPELPRVFGET